MKIRFMVEGSYVGGKVILPAQEVLLEDVEILGETEAFLKERIDSFEVGKVFCVAEVFEGAGFSYSRKESNAVVQHLKSRQDIAFLKHTHFKKYGTQRAYQKIEDFNNI